MSVREARGKVKDMFRQNAHIEDPRTAAILVHKGKAERAAAFERLFFSYVGPCHGTALAIRTDRLESFLMVATGTSSSPHRLFTLYISLRMRCVTPADDAHAKTA